MSGGYMGKILWVNLSTEEIKEEKPVEELKPEPVKEESPKEGEEQ